MRPSKVRAILEKCPSNQPKSDP